MGKKKKVGICPFCGHYKELTTEHIPPRNIFLKPRPDNTITVPSCEKCNQDTKKDDEYYRICITTGAHPNSKLGKLWEEKVVGSTFDRSPRLKKRIQEDHQKTIEHHFTKEKLKTYDGQVVPDHLMDRVYAFDRIRIDKITEKIVRGLFFHHYQKCMPLDLNFYITNRDVDSSDLAMMNEGPSGSVGKEGEFLYWFKVTDFFSCSSKWILLFYSHRDWIVYTHPEHR